MTNNLQGKVAVVTGSGQGIGRAIAIHLAEEGAKVVTNNRRPGSTGFATISEELEKSLTNEKKETIRKQVEEISGDAATTAQVIRDSGGEAVPFFGDISNFDIAGNLIKTAIDRFGRIDILVNVAGTFRYRPVWEMSEEDWNYVNNVKPKSYFNCIRQALPYMMEQKWGRILNCTSAGFKGGGGLKQVNYSTANAAVFGLTYAVAKEVFEFGITCNAFAPGARTRGILETPAHEKSDQGDNAKAAMPPIPGPDELAPFISYLATEEASGISGSVFFVSGSRIGLYSEPNIERSIKKYSKRWTVEELKQAVPGGLMQGYLYSERKDSFPMD